MPMCPVLLRYLVLAVFLSPRVDIALADDPKARVQHTSPTVTLPSPTTADDSLREMTVRPGFTVELVAAEPLTMDPVSFAWGPDGKLWVVEMADYPSGMDGDGEFGGRVRYLEDSDDDGRYDRSTVFLDGLGFPSGVMPWRDGVLVSCAPDIFYAEDSDGDGRSDIRHVLFSGFEEGNQQHRMNGFTWGLDNWVHGANGDSGGVIRSHPREAMVSIAGRDFRVDPDSGRVEPQTGPSQFGRQRDDWGNWFGTHNSNPLFHFVLQDHYLRRNPHVATPNPQVNVSVIPGASPVYPTSRTTERFNEPDRANRFTSACGATIYRDELFGPQFTGNSFVCEPVHNLVHREVIRATGVTFTSQRADDEQRSEFLSSRDSWFRSTMCRTGPDGALWVADMYRHVIEHPEWIPTDWQDQLDVRAGDDRGRIYRVFPSHERPRRIRRLDQLGTRELVAALSSPNGWERDMAHQMLLWQDDDSALEPLRQLALRAERPLARLHALCVIRRIARFDR